MYILNSQASITNLIDFMPKLIYYKVDSEL